jgi:hypothetical protein
MTGDGTYKAFISYNHGSDRESAPALRDALMSLNKPWLQRRAMRVFLDERSMSASSTLWSDLERALDASEFFILLASPGAAKSTWINREVTHWRATKPSRNLLIVVTDGDAVWDPAAGSGATSSSSCAMAGWTTAGPSRFPAAGTPSPGHGGCRTRQRHPPVGPLSTRRCAACGRFRDTVRRRRPSPRGEVRDQVHIGLRSVVRFSDRGPGRPA